MQFQLSKTKYLTLAKFRSNKNFAKNSFNVKFNVQVENYLAERLARGERNSSISLTDILM